MFIEKNYKTKKVISVIEDSPVTGIKYGPISVPVKAIETKAAHTYKKAQNIQNQYQKKIATRNIRKK